MGRGKRANLNHKISEKKEKLESCYRSKEEILKEIDHLVETIEASECERDQDPYEDCILWLQSRPEEVYHYLARWIRKNIPFNSISIKSTDEIFFDTMKENDDIDLEGGLKESWEIAKLEIPGVTLENRLNYKYFITLTTEHEESNPTWTFHRFSFSNQKFVKCFESVCYATGERGTTSDWDLPKNKALTELIMHSRLNDFFDVLGCLIVFLEPDSTQKSKKEIFKYQISREMFQDIEAFKGRDVISGDHATEEVPLEKQEGNSEIPSEGHVTEEVPLEKQEGNSEIPSEDHVTEEVPLGKQEGNSEVPKVDDPDIKGSMLRASQLYLKNLEKGMETQLIMKEKTAARKKAAGKTAVKKKAARKAAVKKKAVMKNITIKKSELLQKGIRFLKNFCPSPRIIKFNNKFFNLFQSFAQLFINV